jgi:hypothetical protein
MTETTPPPEPPETLVFEPITEPGQPPQPEPQGSASDALRLLVLGGAGAIAILVVRSFAMSAVSGLEEDVVMAARAVEVTSASAVAWLLLCLKGFIASGTALRTVAADVRRFGRAGLSLDSSFRHGTEAGAQWSTHTRNIGIRAANFQTLLGMLLTAGWLAMHAGDFSAARDAVTGTATMGMGSVVAGLLELGPKAFITTATALATALVLSTAGAAASVSSRRYLPSPDDLITAWRVGNTDYQATTLEAEQHRAADMVARALSVDQVKELQSTFKSAMHAVGELLGGMAGSMSDLRQTTQIMSQSYKKLELVAAALERSQMNVDAVAKTMDTLSSKVESYGAGLLRGTEAFTERLVQDTSTRIPAVVNAATFEAVRGLEPHIRTLTGQMHKHLQDSADAIQEQYTRGFNDALLRANDRLVHINAMTEALEQRTSLLSQTLKDSTEVWAEAAAKAQITARALGEAGSTTEAVGIHTSKAAAALTEATYGTTELVEQLGRLTQSARSEVESLRRDAELLGRIKEAVHRGGVQ